MRQDRFHFPVVCVAVGLFCVPIFAGEPFFPPSERPTVAASGSARIAPELVAPGQPAPRPSDGLTLPQFEQWAIVNNPAVAQADARVRAAQGTWLQAGLWQSPRIGYQGTQIGDSGTAGQQGAFVEQEIPTAGKLRLNREVAAQEVAEAERMLEAQRFRVLNDVRIAYDDVLLTQFEIDASRQLAILATELSDKMAELFRKQEIAGMEVLNVQIETEFAAVAADRALTRYPGAWRRLTAVAGVPLLPPAILRGNIEDRLPLIEWDDARARLLSESPELAAARAAATRASWAVQREQAEVVPNLTVQAGVQYDNSARDTIANVQVSMPLNILNRNQGGIQRAQQELIAAQADVARTELELQHRLAVTFERYATARLQVERYTTIRKHTQEYYSGLLRNQRELGSPAVLFAQRRNAQAQLSFFESLRELRAASVAIEGLLLTGSLQQERQASETAGARDAFKPELSTTSSGRAIR